MKKGKHLGIRIDEELHYKMQYIAAYEDRSLNGEVLYALRQHARSFEKQHGPIPYPPKLDDLPPERNPPAAAAPRFEIRKCSLHQIQRKK